MKRILIAFTILAGFFVPAHAQRRPAKSEPAPTPVDFAALRDYVNGYEKRLVGRRIVAGDVPLPVRIEKEKYEGMSVLEAGAGDDYSVQLFTSPELAKRLGARQRAGQARARLTCTLVEFRGEFDVSMAAFVTKVEGLGGDGSVQWVEAGPPPSRLKYRF